VRWSLPGEFPTDDLQATTGRPLDLEAGRFVVVVLQQAPGVRQRVPLLFADGGPQTEPISPEVWPDFYRAVQAPDQGGCPGAGRPAAGRRPVAGS
jgi:hypothetical protein